MDEVVEVPIVLVDDDADEHFLFECILTDAELSFQLHAFVRADEALMFLKSRPATPVLVLTDLSLSGCDPIQFLNDSLDYLHGGLCGVFSGTHDTRTEQDVRAAGAGFYLAKPISWQALQAVVDPVPGLTLDIGADGKRRLVSLGSNT